MSMQHNFDLRRPQIWHRAPRLACGQLSSWLFGCLGSSDELACSALSELSREAYVPANWKRGIRRATKRRRGGMAL